MASASLGVANVYVEFVSPETAEPFKYHWYDGDPPFVGVAVNVIEPPPQAEVEEAEFETEAVILGLTVTVTVVLDPSHEEVLFLSAT
jgi:hypothetical protein